MFGDSLQLSASGSTNRSASCCSAVVLWPIGVPDTQSCSLFHTCSSSCGPHAHPTHPPTPPSFQILTALSTVLVLKRRLSRGQWMGIACIVAGLALRALPGGGSAGGTELHAEQWVGAAMIVVSACLYTVLVSVCECTQRAGGGCEEDWVGALGGQGAMVVLLAHTHIRAPSSACTFLHAGDG